MGYYDSPGPKPSQIAYGSLNSYPSTFGQYSISTLESYLSKADPGSIRGTQFALEGRPINSYSEGSILPAFSWMNPVLKYLPSEANLLNKYNAEVILNTFAKKSQIQDQQQSLQYLKDNYSSIKTIPYSTKEGSTDQTRLMHSKMILSKRQGKEVFRLDTAMQGGFFTRSRYDIFYETSNPQLVAEANSYYNALKQGRISNTSNNRYLMVGNQSTLEMAKDIKASRGDVFIQAASITQKEFGSDLNMSTEDREQKTFLSNLLTTIGDKARTGSNILISSKQIDPDIKGRLTAAGVSIGKATDQEQHYNLTYISNVNGVDVAYIGTRRYTQQSHEEIMLRITSKDDPQFLAYLKQTYLSLNKFKKQSTKEFASSQIGELLSENSNYVIAAKYGPSYFYEKAQQNAYRTLGGLGRIDYVSDEGPASSLFKLKYYQQHGTLPSADEVPWYTKQLDKELSTPGLGTYINEYALSHGLGRIYKDEVGALPSIAGAIGAFLDKGLGYYKDSELDAFARREPYNKPEAPVEGPIQQLLQFATNFVLQTSTAILSYVAIGIPATILGMSATRAISQTALDLATSPRYIPGVSELSKATSLGINYTFKSSETIVRELNQIGNRPSKGEELFSKFNLSIASWQNIFMRDRSKFLFNNLLRPIILDFINPYDPHIDGVSRKEYNALTKNLSELAKELGKPIGLAVNADFATSGGSRWVFTNISFERARTLALKMDSVANQLPLDPRLWGLGGRRYSNPKEFTSLGEVFSLSQVLKIFNSTIYGDDLTKLIAESEIHVSADQGIVKNVTAKVATPFSVLGNLASTSFSRFKTSRDMYKPLAKVSNELKILEEELYQQGLLTWDSSTYTRRVSINDSGGERVLNYLNKVEEYQSVIRSMPEELRQKMYLSATNQIESERILTTQIAAASGRDIQSPFKMKTKGVILPSVLTLLSIHLALTDLAQSSGGVSIFSQVVNNLSGSPTEYKDNRILPTLIPGGVAGAYMQSMAYSAFAFGAAAYLSKRTMSWEAVLTEISDVDIKFLGRDHAGNKAIDLVSKNLAQDALVHVGEKSTKIHRFQSSGNRFRNWAFISFGLLAARPIARWAVSAALNTATGIYESVSGKGPRQTLSSNFDTTANLELYRRLVIDRAKQGAVSDVDRLTSYQAGAFAKTFNIVKATPEGRGETIVIARQSPLPFLQIFTAETIKGRTRDSKGNIKDAGTSFFSFGIQSGPAMGSSFSLALPVGIDWKGSSPIGIDLVYNSNPDSMMNYINSISRASTSVYISALVSLATLSASRSILRLASIGRRIESLSTAADSVSEVMKGIKRISSAADALLEGAIDFVEVPLKGWFRINQGDFELLKKASSAETYTKFTSKPSGTTRYIRGLVAGYVASSLISELTSRIIPGEDKEQLRNSILVGGSTVAITTAAFGERLVKPVTAITGHVAPKISNLFNSISNLPGLRRLGGFPKTLLTFAVIGYFLTDSNFGISVDMDRDLSTRIGTIALYSFALAGTARGLANLDKGAAHVLDEYLNLTRQPVSTLDKITRVVAKPLNMFREFQLRKDLNKYYDLLKQGTVQDTTAVAFEHIENINDIKRAGTNKYYNTIQDLINEGTETSTRSLRKVFSSPEFKAISSARGPNLKRLIYRTPVAISLVATAAVTMMLSFGGPSGNGIDNFYNTLDKSQVLGAQSVADFFRLLTFHDSKGYTKEIDIARQYTGVNKTNVAVFGKKLLNPINKDKGTLETLFQDAADAFVLSPMNTFQSVGPLYGLTFRPGEDGTRVVGYIQLQSLAQDISASVYSMAPAFLFKQASANKGEYATLVNQYLGKLRPDVSSDTLRTVSSNVASLTATLQPLSRARRRKFTSISSTSFSLMQGDRIIAAEMTDRQRRLSQLSYQPLLSLTARSTKYNLGGIESLISSKVNKNKIIDSINPNLTEEERLAHFGSPSILKSIALQLFNPLNKTQIVSVNQVIFRDSKGSQIEQPVDDNSEWMNLAGNYELNNFAKNNTATKVFSAVYDNYQNFMSRLPFGSVLSAALLSSLALVGAGTTVSMIANFVFNREISALSRFTETVGKDIFGESFIKGGRGSIELIPLQRFNEEKLVFRQGNKYFQAILPDGFSFKNAEDINKAIFNAQVTIQTTTNQLTQEILADGKKPIPFADAAPKSVMIEGIQGQLKTNLDNWADNIAQALTQDINGSPLASVIGNEGAMSDPDVLKKAIKDRLLNEVNSNIEAALNKNIVDKHSSGKSFLRRYQMSEADSLEVTSRLILKELKSTIDNIKSNLLVLKPLDRNSVEKVLDFIKNDVGNITDPTKAYTSSSISKGPREFKRIEGSSLVKERIKGKVSLPSMLGGIVKGALEVLSVLSVIDMSSSYARLAQSYDDQDLTAAQRRLYEMHAGSTTLETIKQTAIGLTVSATIAAGAAFVAFIGAPIWLAALAVAGIGAGIFAMRKPLLEGWNMLTQTDAARAFGSAAQNAQEQASKFIGSVLIGGTASNINNLTGGFISKGAVTTGIGLSIGAASIAAIAVPLVLAGTTAAGAIAATTALAIGAAALAGLALGVTAGSVPQINNALGNAATWYQEKVSSIPHIGGILATPIGMLFESKNWKFGRPGSPIYSATVSESIAYNTKKYLTASKDYTGEKTKGVAFTTPYLYGAGGSTDPSAIGTVKVPGVMDPVLERELSIRAQYYNHSIIGQKVWRTLLRQSSDYKAIVELEKAKYRDEALNRSAQKEYHQKLQKDLKDLRQSSIRSKDLKVAAAAFKSLTSSLPSYDISPKAVAVANTATKNKNIYNQAQEVLLAKGIYPLHETTTNIEREGNKVHITQSPSSFNDLLHIITNGQISPLQEMGYST